MTNSEKDSPLVLARIVTWLEEDEPQVVVRTQRALAEAAAAAGDDENGDGA